MKILHRSTTGNQFEMPIHFEQSSVCDIVGKLTFKELKDLNLFNKHRKIKWHENERGKIVSLTKKLYETNQMD